MKLDDKTTRTLVWAFMLASFVLSLYLLHVRNLYDDELGSFFMIQLPVPTLWSVANGEDVHPPGMYLLSRCFYLMIGSERWMTVGPLVVLYAGLLIFALRTRSHFAANGRVLFLFLMLVFFHPQLLMWGNSIRWYPYWSGLGLSAFVLGLTDSGTARDVGQNGIDPPSVGRCLLVALVAALMFYVSYLTIPFLAAFGGAWLVRYRCDRRSLVRLGIVLAAFVVLALPQLIPLFEEHLGNRGKQVSSLFVATARMFHGVFVSEAVLPWHPVAPLVLLVLLAVPMTVVLVRAVRRVRERRGAFLTGSNPFWMAATVFFGLLFLAGIASGLGGKPRSFLILPPIAAYIACVGILRINRRPYELVSLLLATVWIVFGYGNLALRQGTAKAGMNDRPDEVVAFLDEQAGDRCAVVFTHDRGLLYAINAAKDNRPWSVCSTYGDHVHGLPEASLEFDCEPEAVFVVKSFIGSLMDERECLDQAMSAATRTIRDPATEYLSRDRDVGFKRRVPGVRNLTRDMPDFRFEVVFGQPRSDADWQYVAGLFDRERCREKRSVR